MFHVKDDFKPGAPVSAVGARWFNKVGAFLNNIVGGRGIKVTRSDSPSAGAPVVIELSEEMLALAEQKPLPSAREAAVGTSRRVAREDHVHPIPPSVYTDEDFDIEDYPTFEELRQALNELDIPSVDLSDYPTLSEMNAAIAAAVANVGVGGGCDCEENWEAQAEVNAAVAAVTTGTGSGAKVPLSALTGNIDGHSGDCLVTIDDHGNLSHSGNNAFDVLAELTDRSTVENHEVTLPFPSFADNATRENVLVGTDANGDLKNLVSLPTSSVANVRVFAIAANDTAVSLQRASLVPVTGGSVRNGVPTSITATAANTQSYTYDGANFYRMTFPVLTRVVWTGTRLCGFYRTLTFDPYGRLYSVTGETMYTIDSPTQVKWS